MTTFEAIILGLIQGVTEFIPVSSSGHLIVAREMLGIRSGVDLSIDAILQLATACAVGWYFRFELLRIAKTFVQLILRRPTEQKERTMAYALLLGTIPAVAMGLFLESYMETTFRSVLLVSITLIVGAFLMWFADTQAQKSSGEITPKKGFIVGIFQSLALFPGMSRSGSTISGGLLVGLSREDAARFSFILSFPIIIGSGFKKILDLFIAKSEILLSIPLLVACITAFVSGLCAIHVLITFLKKHSLQPFIWYRIALAVTLIIFFV